MSQSPQPLIGITGGLTHNQAGSPVCQVGQAYVDAIRKAGGLPVMIPLGMAINDIKALLARLDGVLLSGGGDIDPQCFNGQPHPQVYDISPERDALELALVSETLAADLPLLAICRGIQVLNVALGGGLHTHIADQVENTMRHDWFPGYPRDKIAHSVSLMCGSRLDEIYGADEIRVNSLHHQAIANVGQGLTGTGFAPDGLVEGVEMDGKRFVVGVQWHPECLVDDPGSQSLFRAFVAACEKEI